jgi:hypothetical protein
MLATMPLPEDSPPIDPFPDLSPSGAADPDPKVSSLLSSAQRDEFARAAGSLEGPLVPGFAGEPGGGGDFLLSPVADQPPVSMTDRRRPESSRQVPLEQPVMEVDFLAVPGSEPAAITGAESGLNLQNLAAALIASPTPAAHDEWDFHPTLSPPDSAPPPASESSAGVRGADSGLRAPAPPPPVMATADFMGPTPPVLETPEIRDPAPLPEPASGHRATAAGVPPSLGPETEPDFDEPLAFPVPSAPARGLSPPVWEVADADERGVGMILSGALLIVLGLFLACRVPALALEADALAVSSHPTAEVNAAHLRAGMFLCAAGAAAFLVLGVGSASLRRWAPPLIHAAAWVVLLTVLAGMGSATAAMFYLSANDTAGDAVPADGLALFAGAGLLGIALPLGFIALFQRPSVSRLCLAADRKHRWTDDLTVPALMVFITGLILAVAAFALGIAGAAVPLFGELRDHGSGAQAWSGIGLLTVIAAGFAAAGKRAGWWLLLVISAAMAVSLFLTCRQHDWRQLFHLPATAAASTVTGLLAAAAMFPPILILFMTRKALALRAEA